jgi:glycosyltransferase involved in cell wall biosynthesis
VKIIHLIDHLGLGGSQNLLCDLLEERSEGVEAEVWSLRARALPSAQARLRAAGVAYRVIGLRPDPFSWLALRSRLRQAKPDIVETHLDISSTLGAGAVLALGERRPALIVDIENDPAQHFGPIPRLGLRHVAPRADACIVISDSLREAVRRFLAPRDARMTVIRPGIDLGRFRRDRVDRAEIERMRAGAGRVVGTVARLADQKGVDVLLRSFPAILAREPRARLLVVGDGPLAATLERLAERLGIREAVTFAGYRDDVETAYAAMDVFALASRHEGYGIAFAEAMAMGVPVVGTRVVGSVDAVQDAITGRLVDYGDPSALATAIIGLLEDERLRRRLVDGACAWVAREGSRRTMAARTERLYSEVLAQRPAQG